MNPLKFKVENGNNLRISWDDDSESLLSLKYLRDECPCANCKGETILLKTYRPPAQKIISEEMYRISKIDLVGGYAIQITWKDGHNTGIYSWDYLKQLEQGQSENDKKNKSQNYKPLL